LPLLMPASSSLDRFVDRATLLLDRLESLLPATREPDWDGAVAFRWRRRQTALGVQAQLQPVRQVAAIRLDDLCNIDDQKESIARNTLQFVEGLPANNVLLTGSRGTGKSSLIK